MEIIAHRGASYDAPENTLAAARLAWMQDADAVECDVHLTRDGRLAVIHDDDTRRLSGSALEVTRATWAELQQLEVGRWKNPCYAGEKIPSLGDWLALVPDHKRAFVELKGGPALVPELARVVADRGLSPAQVAVIAFDWETVVAAKHALPRHECCWILAESSRTQLSFEHLIQTCRADAIDGLDLEASWPLRAADVSLARSAGIKIYIWTVDDVATAKRFAGLDVHGLTTNRPGWLRAALEN